MKIQMTKYIRGAAYATIIGAIALLAGGLDPYFAGYDPDPNEKNFETLFSLPMLAAIAVSLLILKFTKQTPDTVQPAPGPEPVPVQPVPVQPAPAPAPVLAPVPVPVQPANDPWSFAWPNPETVQFVVQLDGIDGPLLHVTCDDMHGQILVPQGVMFDGRDGKKNLIAFAWLALAPYMQKTLYPFFEGAEQPRREGTDLSDVNLATMFLANYALTHDGRPDDYDMPH